MAAKGKILVPWWARMALRTALSTLPVEYGVWHKLGVLRHGAMDEPGYALGVFRTHFDRAPFVRRSEFVSLELGPGDSVASALIATAFGARGSILVDVGPFARSELSVYVRLAQRLREAGLTVPDIAAVRSIEELLRVCGARYETGGLRSLRQIETGSIDFVWSHAVLQSVPRTEYMHTLRELRRIVRPDGACSHQIDLRDLLGSRALNHLRFSENVWERDIFRRCGFYSNRLRFSEMRQMFEDAGFLVDVVDVQRWGTLPMSRRHLARAFQGYPDEELRVYGFAVVLRPR